MELDSIAMGKGPVPGDSPVGRASGADKSSSRKKADRPNFQDVDAEGVDTADVVEYPSVIRRTAIIVGVALALFLVKCSLML